MTKVKKEQAGLLIHTTANNRPQFCQQLFPVRGPHASKHGDELALNFRLCVVDLHGWKPSIQLIKQNAMQFVE